MMVECCVFAQAAHTLIRQDICPAFGAWVQLVQVKRQEFTITLAMVVCDAHFNQKNYLPFICACVIYNLHMPRCQLTPPQPKLSPADPTLSPQSVVMSDVCF